MRVHLTGDGNSIAKWSSAPDAVVADILAGNKERARLYLLQKKRDALNKTTEKLTSGSDVSHVTSSLKQSTIPATLQTGSEQMADASLACAFYATSIHFPVIENNYFKEDISVIAKAGPGYKSPGRVALSEKLLTAEVANVSYKLDSFKVQLSTTGGTLVSDGWTNVQNRSLINFLVVRLLGT